MVESKKLDKDKKNGDTWSEWRTTDWNSGVIIICPGKKVKATKWLQTGSMGKMDENIKLIFKKSVVSKLQNFKK